MFFCIVFHMFLPILNPKWDPGAAQEGLGDGKKAWMFEDPAWNPFRERFWMDVNVFVFDCFLMFGRISKRSCKKKEEISLDYSSFFLTVL